MCHKSTHNINVIFIPTWLAGDISDITIDMVRYFSSIDVLKNPEELNFHLNDEDTFRYIQQNKEFLSIPSTSGTPLFKGFVSPLLESEWMNNHEEDFNNYLKQYQIEVEKGDNPDTHPIMDLTILGAIGPMYYDRASNTLVLVGSNVKQPLDYHNGVSQYKLFLKQVLSAIGKHYPYDEIATTELFKELNNEILSLDIVFARHQRNENN